MVRDMREFVADMRQQIDRWKAELATIGDPENLAELTVAQSLRQWIFAGEALLASAGY